MHVQILISMQQHEQATNSFAAWKLKVLRLMFLHDFSCVDQIQFYLHFASTLALRVNDPMHQEEPISLQLHYQECRSH